MTEIHPEYVFSHMPNLHNFAENIDSLIPRDSISTRKKIKILFMKSGFYIRLISFLVEYYQR